MLSLLGLNIKNTNNFDIKYCLIGGLGMCSFKIVKVQSLSNKRVFLCLSSNNLFQSEMVTYQDIKNVFLREPEPLEITKTSAFSNM